MCNLKVVNGTRYIAPCPICGKTKALSPCVNADKYVYKINYTYYCSYTCYRAAQKAKEAKKQTRRKATEASRAIRKEARHKVVEAQERYNTNHFGRLFLEDYQSGLSKSSIALKYNKTRYFVRKYLDLFVSTREFEGSKAQ